MTNSQHHSLLIWHVRDCLTLSFSRTAAAKDCFNYFSCCCYCHLKSTRFFTHLKLLHISTNARKRSRDSTRGRATLRIYNRNYGSHVWASNFTQEGSRMPLFHESCCQSWGDHLATLQRTRFPQLTWASSFTCLLSLDKEIRTAQTLGSMKRQVWQERKVFGKWHHIGWARLWRVIHSDLKSLELT